MFMIVNWCLNDEYAWVIKSYWY